MGEPEPPRAGRRRGRGRRALGEFLLEVANVLSLPPRVPPAYTPSAVPPPPTARPAGEQFSSGKQSAPATRSYGHVWLPSLAALLLVAWSASLINWSFGHADIPVSFRGTWVSQHDGYEGRRLVLTASTVHVIVSGDTNSQPAVVRSATVRSTPTGPRLRLVCATADGADTIEVMLLTPNRLALRRPADVVWERLEDRRASPAVTTSAPEAQPLPSQGAGRDSALSPAPN